MGAPTAMQSMMAEGATSTKKEKQLMTVDGIDSLKSQALTLLSLWALAISCLWIASDQQQVDAIFQRYPLLPTIYGATSVAFAFATALDVLAFLYAVTEEKRILSAVLAYVDFVACMSYCSMATLPLFTVSDLQQGNPVWIARYIEWLATCPTLLLWCGLATRGEKSLVQEIAAGDALMLVGGLVSSLLPGWPGFFVFCGACMTFVYIMSNMWVLFGHAIDPAAHPAPMLPKHALHLMRWEIVVTWSCFGVVEAVRRYGGMDYQVGEAINSVTDYAAKVGLAMIMVNCNLEQYMLRVEQMKTALGGVMKVMAKSNVNAMALDGMGEIDSEIKDWLSDQFAGTVDGGDSSKPVAKGKRMNLDPANMASSSLFSWDFDTEDLSEDELCAVAIRIFDEVNIISQLGLDATKLERFVYAVHDRHKDNPYHNFARAVMTLHTAYMYVCIVALEFCTDLELLALFISALCHDLDHQGVNNAFHINSRSELARTHNDQSVLENHHSAVTFDILFDNSTNLLDDLAKEDYTRVRALVIEMILATDMSAHAAKMARMEEVNSMGGFVNLRDDEDQRAFVLVVLLHTSDLFTPIKPFHVAAAWAGRQQKEFNAQVELEKSMGLPSLPFMQGTGKAALAKGEVGYISFVIRPWFQHMSAAFPELEFLMDNVDSNLERWRDAQALAEE
eukprot:m.169951 g.169951  ORF g.169951 m.169951 type:complete len:676 (+) comp16676_c0_seq8:206-2233(+)